MNLLQIFLTLSGVIIFLLWIDVARRQKFNAIHFIVFIWIGLWLLVFTFFPSVLNSLGSVFWLQRGADLLVYSAIIFLIYMALLTLRKSEEQSDMITEMIREMALENSSKSLFSSNIVFLVRTYNEWTVIWETVQSILDAWYSDVLIVDDGSKDDTYDQLKPLLNSHIVYLKHIKNRGAWSALETGFEYIRRYGKGEFICCFDADGQHSIKDIQKFLTVFEKHPKVQIVFGSRFIEKTNSNIPFLRRIILKLAIVFTFFLSHIKLSDAHNGFRVFRREALNQIHLTIGWMGYASELIDIIAAKRIPFKEVPVDIKYTDYSLSKWQKNSNAVNVALKFIWSKFFK